MSAGDAIRVAAEAIGQDPIWQEQVAVLLAKADELDRAEADWIDLGERLDRADKNLCDICRKAGSEEIAARVASKIEGVRLARDYMRGY